MSACSAASRRDGSAGRAGGRELAAGYGTLGRTATRGDPITTTAYDETTARWTIDPEETQVEFDVKTFWGFATVHGHFDRFDGVYETYPDGMRIELTADADSLDTGNDMRDKYLRSAQFFHVAEHPEIHFLSTSVHDAGSGSLEVIGRLGTAGRATSLKFPATLRRVGDDLEVEATTTVDQRELGMSTGTLGMIRRPATLHVKARLTPAE